MTMDQAQRTRELLQGLTRSSPAEVERWASISGRVAVVLGREAALTENGQLAFFTAVNLLARLHPVITELVVYIEADAPVLVHAPLFDGQSVSEATHHFTIALNPPVRLTFNNAPDQLEDAEIVLTAGTFYPGLLQISFGSDGWNLTLDSRGRCSFTNKFNPVGSMSVACLAVSEAFKRVFVAKASRTGLHPDSLPPVHLLDGYSSTSILTYSASTDDVPNPALPDKLDIGKMTVIGAGAGGGACLYALATLPLSGEIWIVDPDVVNSHNLNRYIYATEADAVEQRKKVDIFGRLLGSQNLKCCSFDMPFMDFKEAHPNWPREMVLSTVDTAEARHAIQWETPRIILDAAVGQSTFYVHRVDLGRSACLKCTHTASSERADTVHAIAEITGLDYAEVSKLYFDNISLTAEVARAIGQNVAQRGLPAPDQGMTLRDWIMLHCGQLKLNSNQDLVLPIPFATVLPGILLAGEIIKEKYFPGHVLKHRLNHDVFGHPSGSLTTLLNPKPGCPLCGDEEVMKVYQRLYSPKGNS